ncbi:MAG: hypothetical protein H6Q66_1942 [Firmicutes bacterium]|nr:hypothetical protein [Bacillota bacterium]
MEWLFYIGWLIAGTVLYAVVCKAFNVVHFGVSAMFSFWFGCMLAVGVIGALLGGLVLSIISMVVGFVTAYYKWIIGAIVALIILGIYINKTNENTGQSTEQEK